MDSKQRPIGIFDSGVGGLTFAKALQNILPNEDIIYFGDTKHLPYGEKSPETIIQYSSEITDFLLERDCKSIVIACNSASSNALETVKEKCGEGVEVFDVINPVVERVSFALYQNIGVIATRSTVGSGIYKKSIRKLNRHLKVLEVETPLLAPMIEEGFAKTEVSRALIDAYLGCRKFNEIDSLILGCTHYPLIEKEIEQYYNGRVEIINSPIIVADYIYRTLENKNLLNSQNESGKQEFYVSDLTKGFEKHAKMFFGKHIELSEKDLWIP